MAKSKKDEPVLLTKKKEKKNGTFEDLSGIFDRAMAEAAADPDGLDEEKPFDVSQVLQAVVDEHATGKKPPGKKR